MVVAEPQFRPEKKREGVSILLRQVKQFFKQFEQAGLGGLVGGGFVEQRREVGCNLHGAPVCAEDAARMEQGTFFSDVKRAGAFLKKEQLAGAEEFIFAEKGAFRAQGAFQ